MRSQPLVRFSSNSGKLPTVIRVYRRFFTILVIAVSILLISTLGIKGTMDQITSVQISIAESEAKLAVLNEKENLLRSVDKGTFLEQEKKLDEAIPPIINLPVILATLQKIAVDSSLELGEFSISSTVQIISVLPIEQADKLSSFQFSVNVSGVFEDIKLFADTIPTVLPFLRMEKIEFTEDKTKATIVFYFQPKSLAQKLVVDSALEPLTSEHTKAINDVYSLTPPVLEEVSIATRAGEVERESPFR